MTKRGYTSNEAGRVSGEPEVRLRQKKMNTEKKEKKE